MLIAGKARFAAGEGATRGIPDVFTDQSLAARYRALWAHLTRELMHMPMLMGIEPMSEPRNKQIMQSSVRGFYEGVCGAIASVDPRMGCVVGPTPYYKVWQLNSTMLLRTPSGRPMDSIIYTFDFFDPWDYVTEQAAGSGEGEEGYRYPSILPCSVAFRGWVSTFCPSGRRAEDARRSQAAARAARGVPGEARPRGARAAARQPVGGQAKRL